MTELMAVLSAIPVLLLAWLWLSLVMGVVVGRWLRTRSMAA